MSHCTIPQLLCVLTRNNQQDNMWQACLQGASPYESTHAQCSCEARLRLQTSLSCYPALFCLPFFLRVPPPFMGTHIPISGCTSVRPDLSGCISPFSFILLISVLTLLHSLSTPLQVPTQIIARFFDLLWESSTALIFNAFYMSC